MKYLLCLSLLVFAATPVLAERPIVLYGDDRGIWSPSHPHMLPEHPAPRPVQEIVVEHSEVQAERAPEPEEEPEKHEVCPTQLSAPHLCVNYE